MRKFRPATVDLFRVIRPIKAHRGRLKVLGEAFHLGLAGASQPHVLLEEQGARVEGEAKLDIFGFVTTRAACDGHLQPCERAVFRRTLVIERVFPVAAAILGLDAGVAFTETMLARDLERHVLGK